MTASFRLRPRHSHSSTPSWPEDLLDAGISCESNTNRDPSNGPSLDTASDYGSDFSPEEQDVLNGLLDSFGSNTSAVSNNRTVTDVDITDFDFTASQEVALNDLLDSLPSPGIGDTKDLAVKDIEDYEEPKGIRVPKVLGKEQWIPPWKKILQRQMPDAAVASGNSSNAIGTSALR